MQAPTSVQKRPVTLQRERIAQPESAVKTRPGPEHRALARKLQSAPPMKRPTSSRISGRTLTPSSPRHWAACVATLLASSSACEASGAGAGADIRYTEYGIAHVRAPDRRSLGVGVGYGQARDNLCAIEVGMLALDGQLSRYFGPDELDSSWALGAQSNLESDLFFQGQRARGSVERLLEQPPPIGPSPAVRQLVRGYVEGFNAMLAEGPSAECAGAEWLRPMLEIDVYRRAHALATFMGQGIAAGAIASAVPPASSVEVLGSLDVAQPAIARAAQPASGSAPGSNAVALGSEVTASGGGINVANPHLRWDLALRWWQSQLTIADELDASGALVIGLPVVVMGHTESVAWRITTAEQTQHFTIFELQLADGSPTTYLVDGEAEEMERQDVSVDVRRPDGTVDVVTQAQWWTRYGPVLGPRFGLPWTAGGAGTGRAYAVADPNAGNLRVLDLLFAFDTATSVGDILGALRRHQAAPWWTVVAADADGQALFSQLQVVAHVTDRQIERCVSPMWQGLYAAERLTILDGSRGDCAWGSDEDALEPGIFGPGAPGAERLPVLSTRGYVANSNGSHWLPSVRDRIEGKPGIVGPERTAPSPRTQDTFVEIEE
ncbi:MAG TPA: penicillin acylase family protein, partial [Polyangiaceae bacterium]|nr:penicillin acylase family protein [Polyangiaceae bacterium]